MFRSIDDLAIRCWHPNRSEPATPSYLLGYPLQNLVPLRVICSAMLETRGDNVTKLPSGPQKLGRNHGGRAANPFTPNPRDRSERFHLTLQMSVLRRAAVKTFPCICHNMAVHRRCILNAVSSSHDRAGRSQIHSRTAAQTVLRLCQIYCSVSRTGYCTAVRSIRHGQASTLVALQPLPHQTILALQKNSS